MKAQIKVLLIVLTISLNSMDYAVSATKTWSGNTSTDWNNSGNWVGGIVADSSDNIVINSNAPNNLILTQNQKITNLTINGDTVDLGGFTFEITGTAYFNGGLVKNGMLKPTGSLCHFGGATFDARIEATCGYFHMNSGVYKKPVFLTSTGAATSSSTYGNHFEDSLTITNNGAVYFNMGSSGEDIYDGPVILYNYSSKEIRLAATDTSFFNNGIYINDSLGGVEFGVSGGVSILASGKTISVGTFSSNYLTLNKFIQLGSTAQTLTLTGTGVVSLESCIFNGNLTINAPGILTKTSTYNGNTTFNRTGSATNFHSYGSNIYAGNVTWDNAGSGGRVRLASTAPDTYLADATFSSSGGQDMQVAYVGDNAFSGNITITSNKVVFNTSTGKVTFTGTNNQTLNGSYNYPFKKLAINKTAGTVTANTTLSVDDSLIFIQGNLITTSTNLLTMKHGSTAYGASNSSFVSGPVKKVGNSSFIFPIGIGGTYRSLGMSAPSNSSNAYTAEYFNIVQTFGSTLDSTIQEISNCDYWSFVNNSGTSPVNLTLSWDSAFCWQFDTTYMNIVYWNSSKWKDIGHGTCSGNILNGTTTSTQQINQFGYFTLAQNSLKPSYSPSFAVLDDYAILAKDSVVSELMYVLGKVGSGGLVDSTISASDSILQSNSGTVAAAMAEALAIMNDLDSINGTILSNDLSELNLFEGIYEIGGDAILNGTFHLYGDSTSTFVFKISDSLKVSQNSTMELHGVHPKNIFWRIEGHSNFEDSIIFYGILLSDSNITVSSNGGQLSLISETFIDIKNPISENYFKHIRSISKMFIPFQYVSLPTCNAPVFDCNYIINPGLESGAIPNDQDGFQLGWVDCWMNFMCNGVGCLASTPTGGNNTPDILDVGATNVFGFRSCNGPGGAYDSFGIPENTMCNSTPTLSSSAYATTNTRYSTMFRTETISGTLNKTLEPGFYITGFWSKATDCMCPNQEAAATVCINIFDTPTGTCNQDQIGFMNLWNLNKSKWEYHDACLDLTALTQLSAKNYIGFSMNYPIAACGQSNNSGRVLVDDFTLTKVADAGPDEFYCITDLDGIEIGPECENPLYNYTYSWTASTGAAPAAVQNPIVFPTVTTTYTLTVTMDHPNGMSCFDTDQVTVTVVPGFTLSSSSTPATSGSNGTATVNVSGGSPNYNYLWSTSASSNSSSTTNTISGLTPGIYTVSVTDANGCTNTTTIEVESPCASSPLTISVTPSTLSACSGQNFLLTANVSGGTSPITYQWDLDGLPISGATSQTLTTSLVSSVPDVFTYTVVVTDGNLCTATANATVTINPLPTVSIDGGLGICIGQPTTLTAQPSPAGTYTYLWSNSATTAATQISVDGNYTVTVTNSFGCTATQSATVVDDNTSFNIVGNLANCERSVETSVYSIFPYNAANPTYYDWSVSGALTLISVNTSTGEATIEFPSETGGTITVVYENPITGCIFTTTLHVYDCCREGDSAPVIANASTSDLLALLGSTYVNVSGSMVTLTAPGGLYVNGALTLDTDLNIRDCDLKFGPGARILVPPNFELTIDFSYLHAGCDVMWRGIELQGTNSTLIANNIDINVATEIEDAQYGVLVQNGANYIVWNDVIFKNNFIGMQVNGPTFQTRYITETKFAGDGYLLPMYPGQSPQVCSWPFAGMELNSVFNGINIGDATYLTPQVTFEYLNIGILSRFSNPSVFNSHFDNIRTPGDNACFNAASLLYRGSGIAQLGGTARPASVLLQRGFGMLSSDPVSFTYCLFGVYADNSTIDIQENRMTNVNTGVFERNASPFLQNLIFNNNITANNFGVQIIDATYASDVKVYFNEITVNNTLGGFQGNRAGVNVIQNNLTFIPYRIAVRNNDISVGNARFGINFSNISNTDATDNIISLTATPMPTKTGIRQTSVNNHSTGCNVITQLGSQSNFGVFSQSALNSIISCNITTDLNTGFRVSGNSSGMDFSGNVMNNGNRGLDLANGIMGQQFDQGNQWPDTYPNWGARIMGSNPLINRFRVELPIAPPLWPSSINDLSWFTFHTCPGCADECTIVGEGDYYCEPPARISKLNVTLVDSTAVAGDSLTTEYVEEFLWQTRRDLYSDLLLNPSLQDSSSVMEDFVVHHVDSTYAQFAILENNLSNPYVEEMSAFDQVKSYYASIDSLFMQIRQNDSLYFTGLSSLDSLEVLNRNSELRLQIDSIVNLSKDFEILMRSAFEGVIESAYEYNLGLSGSSLPYENNEFQLNRIGLTMQIEKRDTLTEDEVEIIESIASQCIYEGGKVVIRARNLYHFYVNDSIDFEDSTFCGYSYRSANHLIENQYINSESLQVYPNPANNLLTLVYTSDINAGSAINLSIFDPTGRSVLNKSLNGTTGRYYIDISGLNEGIYFVKVKTLNGAKLDHKLVIIR